MIKIEKIIPMKPTVLNTFNSSYQVDWNKLSQQSEDVEIVKFLKEPATKRKEKSKRQKN